jgi:hypothetical protein
MDSSDDPFTNEAMRNDPEFGEAWRKMEALAEKRKADPDQPVVELQFFEGCASSDEHNAAAAAVVAKPAKVCVPESDPSRPVVLKKGVQMTEEIALQLPAARSDMPTVPISVSSQEPIRSPKGRTLYVTLGAAAFAGIVGLLMVRAPWGGSTEYAQEPASSTTTVTAPIVTQDDKAPIQDRVPAVSGSMSANSAAVTSALPSATSSTRAAPALPRKPGPTAKQPRPRPTSSASSPPPPKTTPSSSVPSLGRLRPDQ